MRLLHRNIGSCVIVVPNLDSLDSVYTTTTAGGRVDGEVDKKQDQDQEKGGYNGT